MRQRSRSLEPDARDATAVRANAAVHARKSAMRAPRPRECVPHAPALSTRPVGYPAKLRYLLNYCSSRDKTPAARTPTSAFFSARCLFEDPYTARVRDRREL